MGGLAVVLLFTAWLALSPNVTRGPYLQESSPSSLVVRWRTSLPVRSLVRYGLSPAQLSLKAGSQMRGTDHAVLLAGLTPATKYYYEVATSSWGRGRSKLESFVTPPATGSAAEVRVWVLGDSGTADETQEAVRDAFVQFSSAHPADLCLMLGDNAYPSGTQAQYQQSLFDFYPDLLSHTPLWPTLGNHDARSADPKTQSGVYFDLFNLPTQGQCGGVMSGTEAYYAFDHANIHFVCLDSEGSNRDADGPMLSWLKEDLRANRQLWTVAYWHQPPYTKGTHDSDLGRAMREMRENALPILEDAGVDLVLGGHSHDYERSYLLDGHYGNSDTFSESMIKGRRRGVPDESGPYLKPSGASHSGAVYVVLGSSGQTGQIETTPHPAMCVSLQVAGSLALDINGSRLDATFLDGMGKMRDHFTIVKQSRQSAAQESMEPGVTAEFARRN